MSTEIQETPSTFEASHPHAMYLDSPYLNKTASSLATVFYELRGSADTRPYQLVITSCDREEAIFTKEIVFAEGAFSSWVAVNTHLLPNGICSLAFRLKDQIGRVVAERSISLNVANQGTLAEAVRRSLERFNTPVIVEACDTTHYDYSDCTLIPWFDRADALDTIQRRLSNGEISAADAAALEEFVVTGYLVVPDLLDEALIRQINQEIDNAIETKVEGYEYGSSQRIHQLHQRYPGVRKLWAHPEILRLLRLIFESPARPCQSLTYVFGSQQYVHQDTIFLTAFPAGYMCGVWVSLEDIQPNSGELEIYPGSHRLPRVYMHDIGLSKLKDGDWPNFEVTVPPIWKKMIDAGQFERVIYRPKAGTALIWHENLMHGGSVRLDTSLSRRSIVTHNFANGAIAFYDSTGHIGYMEPLENLTQA